MKTIIEINDLDDGHVLTINGKTKAVQTISDIRDIISDLTKDAIKRIESPSVTRSIVTIEFEENPSQSI